MQTAKSKMLAYANTNRKEACCAQATKGKMAAEVKQQKAECKHQNVRGPVSKQRQETIFTPTAEGQLHAGYERQEAIFKLLAKCQRPALH